MSTPKSAAASEESYQNAKSSLVSSLVELSTAATQTATAALNFYKYAGTNGADAATASASLKTLSETVLAAANAASMTLANGSAPEPKRTIAKPQKKKEAAPAAAPASAPAPAPAPASVSAPSSASSDVTADTTMSDVLSTTDPALLKQGLEKPKKKRAEKDPNAPKKPVTSYLRFNLAERQRLKKERGESGQPTLQATELNQIIADRWATLDDVAKLELQRAYEADYEVYKKNVEDYKTKKLTELASAAQEAQGSPVLDAVSEPAAPKPAAPKPAAPKPVAPKPAAQKPAAPKPAAQKPAPAQPAAVAPVPAADQASAPVPSSSTEKPKKKKKASKKNAEASEADALALATETAKAAIAAEEAQVQPKPSKKRKDKDASEKSSKKKKSDPQA